MAYNVDNVPVKLRVEESSHNLQLTNHSSGLRMTVRVCRLFVRRVQGPWTYPNLMWMGDRVKVEAVSKMVSGWYCVFQGMSHDVFMCLHVISAMYLDVMKIYRRP